MNLTKIRYLFLLAVMCIMVNACKKDWQGHNAITNPQSDMDLYQELKADASLSRFADLVQKSGYDKLLAGSKTYTVWAPANDALNGLSDSIVNDTAKLRLFVGNYIASQVYNSVTPVKMRLGMVSGKYMTLYKNIIDSATITVGDHYAKNGMLHVINKIIQPLGNTWDVLRSNAAIPQRQVTYMNSLFRKQFSAATAVQTGVDTLGNPIYKPGTDSVYANTFLLNVSDLTQEAKQFTMFVMADAGWDAEVNKLTPYFATGSADSTRNLASFEVVKDLVLDTVYTTVADMPDFITSKFGVKMYLAKTSIKQTIRTSNGVIYVIDQLPVSPGNRLREFKIEGENYRSTSVDRRGNTYFRDRVNPVTGSTFRDVLVINHGVSQFNIRYQVSGAYSAKYKAYWVAVNDFQAAAFQQKLSIDVPLAVDIPYITVPLNSYTEQYLGEFTLNSYKANLNIYLVAAASTTQAVNPLVCDYIRLVPTP